MRTREENVRIMAKARAMRRADPGWPRPRPDQQCERENCTAWRLRGRSLCWKHDPEYRAQRVRRWTFIEYCAACENGPHLFDPLWAEFEGNRDRGGCVYLARAYQYRDAGLIAQFLDGLERCRVRAAKYRRAAQRRAARAQGQGQTDRPSDAV